MTTSTLRFDDFRKWVGRFLGFTEESSAWSPAETERIDFYVTSGFRRAYLPQPIPGETKVHEWSFLRPTTSIFTVDNQGDYDMPPDFGGITGPITYDAEDDSFRNITITSESQIRQYRQNQINAITSSGRPEIAAVRFKKHDGVSQQRYEMMLWPTPNGVYTLSFRYRVNPILINYTQEYPYGTALFGEMFLESCLAVAEEREDDGMSQTHQNRFLERLVSAVYLDRQAHSPENLGYNRDNSGHRNVRYRHTDGYVTVGGTLYPTSS